MTPLPTARDGAPPPPPTPLVSIAFPLYRSRPFLANIIANIERVSYPRVEIVISDRHRADDALELLEEHFRHDPRVNFLKGRDELDWVAHYNLLLERAAGEYFCWMPHDDSFPADYVSQLVAELERHADAVLAFGRIEAIKVEDAARGVGDDAPGTHAAYPLPPLVPGEEWSPRVALRLLTQWNLGIPFRGVLRREALRGPGIRPTRGNVLADMYWVFGLALCAPLVYVPGCHCVKRLYPTSTHARWGVGARHMLDAFFVLRSYTRDHTAPGRDRRHAFATLACWTLSRLLRVAGNRLHLGRLTTPTLQKPLDAVLRRLLRARR